MSVDALISLASLGIVLLGNIVYFTVYLTKVSSRTTICESRLIELHKFDTVITEDLKSLAKIDAQLELLIKHIIPTKT